MLLTHVVYLFANERNRDIASMLSLFILSEFLYQFLVLILQEFQLGYSSAAVTNPLQGSIYCAFKQDPMYNTVLNGGYMRL